MNEIVALGKTKDQLAEHAVETILKTLLAQQESIDSLLRIVDNQEERIALLELDAERAREAGDD